MENMFLFQKKNGHIKELQSHYKPRNFAKPCCIKITYHEAWSQAAIQHTLQVQICIAFPLKRTKNCSTQSYFEALLIII